VIPGGYQMGTTVKLKLKLNSGDIHLVPSRYLSKKPFNASISEMKMPTPKTDRASSQQRSYYATQYTRKFLPGFSVVGNMLELEHSQMTRNTGTMQYGQII